MFQGYSSIIKAVIVLAGIAMAGPGSAQPVSLDRLSAWLDGFSSATARFDQVNPDGTRSRGSIAIQRPGRMRLDYDAPQAHLVIAQAGSVTIFDGHRGSDPAVYPLNRTPLRILLDRQINLAGSNMVAGHRNVSGHTVVQMRDPRDPDLGELHLIFRPEPLALHGWVSVDVMGQATRVTLSQVSAGASISGNAFNVDREMQRRGLISQH